MYRRLACATGLLLAAAVSCAQLEPSRKELVTMGLKPEPPALPKRPVAKPDSLPGMQIEIVDGDYKPILFIPDNYQPSADGKVRLTVHFHGGVWYPIQEHLRRGLSEPLLVCHFGEGSSVYARPFATDPDRLSRFIASAEKALEDHGRKRNLPAATVTQIDITSFSAGYGAVREIVKHDQYVRLIRRVILCDSLYADWEPATTQPSATSRPADRNMKPWEMFVTLAARGEKTFVLVHSHVPTPYANTAATAQWLIDLVGAPRVEIPAGSTPASSDPDFPMLYRADLGRFHVWGHAGEDAPAHLTSVRHLAEIWTALDACNDGR